jgi:hypothetical protein
MSIFSDWFTMRKKGNDDARLWLLREKAGERKKVLNGFCQTVRSHYDSLSNISADINKLGYRKAAKILKERLPTAPRAQSGELGEIMATEFTEDKLGFLVPVKRLRYKDGRNMALRGDDFIGIYVNQQTNDITLLKGESKSYVAINQTVVSKARAVLDRDNGRCTPISLVFVADRLMERSPVEKEIGERLRHEIALKALKPESIYHAFFSLTGNDPEQILADDLNAADKSRTQTVINIRIEDHQLFIEETYKEVAKLGNK